MNSTLRSADRITHVKIVLLSLIASIIFVVVGINAHIFGERIDATRAQTVVVKAGMPANYTDSGRATIR